jgi:lipopolysaccharide export system permease protein
MIVTVARYLTKAFLLRTLATLLALSALLQLLDLLDASSKVLDQGGGAVDLLRYVSLRLPSIMERLAPLATLIGALSALSGFAAANEFVAMRSVGMTPYQIMGALFPAALVIAFLHFILADQIAPRSERAFIDWWRTKNVEDQADPAKPVWFRLGSSIASVEKISADGRSLNGLSMVERDEQGRATILLTAHSADYSPEGWVMRDVTRMAIGDAPLAVTREASATMALALSPANMTELREPTENMSMSRLLRIIRGGWAGTQSASYYETQLHTTYTGPLSSLVMLLLAAPTAHGMRRRGGGGGNLALGIAIGLGFILASGILSSMGQAGALPPAIAAWSPLLFFACLGGAIMAYIEG